MRRDNIETAESRRDQCFSSIECLTYLEARDGAPVADAFQRHFDACERCRVLVAETAREVFAGDAGSGLSSTLRTLNDGEVLGGRYEIRRFIARGGMGEVYEAFDQTLGERIALKTLSLTTLDQPQATTALIAEVRLARKVVHPNVCRIFEFSLHRRANANGDVVPFLTMELLEGETLTSRLRREGPLPPERALRMLHELADGLAAVHRAAIVHRDFKADNVFLVRATDTAPERAVVMDFGLARALEIERGSRHSSARGLAGTVAYMAPEQVEGARPTPSFDVYALGTVGFELLCGRLPFVAESQLTLATLRLRLEPPRPSSLRPGLNPVWDWFFMRCLARDTGSRFRSIDAVTRALSRIGAGDTAKVSRFFQWLHQPRVIVAGIALLLAGGATVAVRYASRAGGMPVARTGDPATRPTDVAPSPRAIEAQGTGAAVTARSWPTAQQARVAASANPLRRSPKGPAKRPPPSRLRVPVAPSPSVGGPGPEAPAAAPPGAAPSTNDDFIDPFLHLRAPAAAQR